MNLRVTLCSCNGSGERRISAGIFFLLQAIALLSAFVTGAVRAAETKHEINPKNGIETWEVRDQGVFLSLTQMTPDQAEAFFLARGFHQKSAKKYASACVFETIFRNESAPAAVSSNLADWRIITPQGERHLKLEADWDRQWKADGVSEPARIAFRWSQFPTKQRFEPGDWNQGMTTFGLPRNSQFNLIFKWTVKGVSHESMLSGVRCAPDNDSR